MAPVLAVSWALVGIPELWPACLLAVYGPLVLPLLFPACCCSLCLLFLLVSAYKTQKVTSSILYFVVFRDFNRRSPWCSQREVCCSWDALSSDMSLRPRPHLNQKICLFFRFEIVTQNWKSLLFQRIQRILRAIFDGRVEHVKLYTFFICTSSTALNFIEKH